MQYDRPTPSFRRVLRFFSLGLYFMMFVFTLAAVSYGWQKDSQLKEARLRISQLETQLDAAQSRIRALEADAVSEASFDRDAFERAVSGSSSNPLPPLRIAQPSLLAVSSDRNHERTIEFQRARIEELERQLAETRAAADEMKQMGSNANLHAANPEAPPQVDEMEVAWARAQQSPEDRTLMLELAEKLRGMGDAELMQLLARHSSSGGEAIALDLIRTRKPGGGDVLAASLLRRTLVRSADDVVVVTAHIAALEPYRTEAALDGLFAAAASQAVAPADRASALWPLILAQDFRGGALVGEVFASLPPGTPERITVIGLAQSTRDPGMLDAALGAFADPASTEAELRAATEACRSLSQQAAPRLATLAGAMREREMDLARVALVSGLAGELEKAGERSVDAPGRGK